MDIRNSLDGLKSLLGTGAAAPASTSSSKGGSAQSGGLLGADKATVSSAGTQASSLAGESGVRMDKVAGIQAQLAAGTYNVPASALASRMVDVMLGGQL